MILLDCSSSGMRVLFSAVFVILVQTISAGKDQAIYCGACMAMVEEIELLINREDKKKMIEVGSFRINPDGTQGLRRVPYARSDVHLTDVLEKVCSAMEIYGLTTDEEGKTNVIRQKTLDGGTISSKYIQKTKDITGSLLYACENILEDHEDLIIKLFKVNASFEETATKLCHETADTLFTRRHRCNDLREETEDELMAFLKHPNKNAEETFCIDIAGLCHPGNFTDKLLAQGRAMMASMREKAENPEGDEEEEEDNYEEEEEEEEEEVDVDADEDDGQLAVDENFETDDSETKEKEEL